MPKFIVHIDRPVIGWDRFTRVIEADDEAHAKEAGDFLAREADETCPDDAGPGTFEPDYEPWAVNEVSVADDLDLQLYSDEEPMVAREILHAV